MVAEPLCLTVPTRTETRDPICRSANRSGSKFWIAPPCDGPEYPEVLDYHRAGPSIEGVRLQSAEEAVRSSSAGEHRRRHFSAHHSDPDHDRVLVGRGRGKRMSPARTTGNTPAIADTTVGRT